MGASKSYRGGPAWAERNTPGGTTKVSKGAIVKPEGTHSSGPNDYGRKGMKNTARAKSHSRRSGPMNPGIHGYS
jgi:hypothetical protein